MGCIVNGPGESKHADIGISLPGDGENPVAVIYEDGKKSSDKGFVTKKLKKNEEIKLNIPHNGGVLIMN